MFTIQNSNIRMTQGDSASFTVEILLETEEGATSPYEMKERDTLLFTAKRCICDRVPALQLRTVGTPQFHLQPQDTKHMLGRYVYDVELRTDSGEIHTVLGPGDEYDPELEILAEVTE